ncbi:MAG: hypothetical protein ACI8TP_002311 [Acidimicrobiales bacterium]
MAAPDYVPTDPTQRVRRYSSPPRREGSWSANRPGDLPGGQPTGVRLGSQGPDQGYIFKLLPLFQDRLYLGAVHEIDASAGCAAVAMKRAAHFGRAPVVHDLRIAYTVFGFLDPDAPVDLVAFREGWFAEVSSSHHYAELRDLVDRVPIDVLSKSPGTVDLFYETDWRRNLNL